MADKTDDLLISVSTDLTTIKRQLKQLGQDIGTTTSGIQKQFDGLGKGIDQSLTPIQKRINDMMGIASSGTKPLKEWKGALADVAVGFNAVGKGAQISSNQLLNLSRQGNDVITMFALGAKPMQIFASQAGQVFGALQEGPGGVTGSLKGLGAQAVALATKFPLATAAIAAAGVAVAAYLALGGSSIRSLDEILKSHEENIKRLGDAYDQVVGKQQKYAQYSASTANLVNEKDLADAKDRLRSAIDEVFSSATTQSGVGRGGGTREFVKAAFAPFQEALDDLKNSAKDTSALDAFIEAVTAIGRANPDLKGPAQDLISFAKNALDASSVVQQLAGAIPDAVDTVDSFKRALDSVDSKPMQKELQDVFDKAREGTEPIDAIIARINALEDANPTFAGIIEGFRSIIIEASKAASAVANINLGGTRTKDDNAFPPTIKLPDSAPTPDSAPNREDQGVLEDKLAARRSRTRSTPKTANDRFAEDIQSIKDRTAALQAEASMIGLSYEEQIKRSTALDLEQTALKQVREEARKKGDADWQNAQLSPQQIAQIDEQSAAYARQKEVLKELQEQYDFQKDVLKGVFDDLRSALEDGKLDWQDFGKIAEDVLDKIIDKIENDLVDAIMQASSTGGGGGLGGIFGAIFGGGGSSNIFPGGGVLNSTGGLYADGGFTGSGGKNQPAGIVHKGEYVFDQDAVNRIGVGNLAMLQHGYANGGLVGAPSAPRIRTPGHGGAPSLTFAPTINMPNAQKGAGEEVTAALKAYQKDFVPNVLKALREAKQRGMV